MHTDLKIGWKRTLVTGARWPLKQNFSGGLGIHSLGVLLSREGAPDIYSFSASASLASNSLTWINASGINKNRTFPTNHWT